jgi:hypothetical protein
MVAAACLALLASGCFFGAAGAPNWLQLSAPFAGISNNAGSFGLLHYCSGGDMTCAALPSSYRFLRDVTTVGTYFGLELRADVSSSFLSGLEPVSASDDVTGGGGLRVGGGGELGGDLVPAGAAAERDEVERVAVGSPVDSPFSPRADIMALARRESLIALELFAAAAVAGANNTSMSTNVTPVDVNWTIPVLPTHFPTNAPPAVSDLSLQCVRTRTDIQARLRATAALLCIAAVGGLVLCVLFLVRPPRRRVAWGLGCCFITFACLTSAVAIADDTFGPYASCGAHRTWCASFMRLYPEANCGRGSSFACAVAADILAGMVLICYASLYLCPYQEATVTVVHDVGEDALVLEHLDVSADGSGGGGGGGDEGGVTWIAKRAPVVTPPKPQFQRMPRSAAVVPNVSFAAAPSSVMVTPPRHLPPQLPLAPVGTGPRVWLSPSHHGGSAGPLAAATAASDIAQNY